MPDFECAYDHTSAEFASRKDEIGAHLRESCPLASGTEYGGFRVLSRHSDITAVIKDPEVFSSSGGTVLPGLEGAAKAIPVDVDPPDHRRYRGVLNRYLGKTAAVRYAPEIRDLVGSMIDGFSGRGRADLIAELAVPLPLAVTATVLGLPPDDRPVLRELFLDTLAAMASGEEALLGKVFLRFGGFLSERLAEKRRDPADDLMSAIAVAPSGETGFSDADQVGLCVGVIMAGQDSTAMAIGNLILHLCEHPGTRQLLIEHPEVRSSAIEESLRMASPLQHIMRTVKKPIELHGRILRPDERVLMNLGAANRDPRQFEQPEVWDPYRSPNRHLAFGIGIHHCAGIHLARLELNAVLDQLLDRLPNFEVVGDPTRELQSGTVYGPPALEIEFAPSTATLTPS